MARGILHGEVISTDGTGVLFAVERIEHFGEAGASIGAEPTEGSHPMFAFVPWSQIEMITPLPGQLP